MSAVGTASVSPDNPLRARVAAAVRSCRRSPTSTPSTAARRCSPAWPSSAPRSPRSSPPDEPPTFENTVVALERSGRLLARAEAVFGNLASSVSTPRLREIEREIAPLEAAHSDALRLDPALFARIDAVHAGAARRRARRRGGAAGRALPPGLRAGRRRSSTRPAGPGCTELNQELSDAVDDVRAEPAAGHRGRRRRGSTDAAELDGLDAEEIAAAATAAADRGRRRATCSPLVLPTGQPVLAKLRNRDLRRRVFEASVDAGVVRRARQRPGRRRGSRSCGPSGPGCSASTPTPTSSLADQTARTTAAVDAMLGVDGARVGGERRGRGGGARRGWPPRDGVELAAWDWAFYSEQVRAERYAVDTAALRPWFELDRVLVDGVFHAAELLYGYRFTPRPDLRRLPPRRPGLGGQRRRRRSRSGLYLGDFYAREGKRGGAWMSSFVTPVAAARHPPGRGQQPQRDPAGGRAADAADPRRGQHAVPRVRPRAARAELRGHLPAVLRHQRAARLRRVPEPGQRDVGAVAGGPRPTTPGTSRPASRCRRAVVEAIDAAAAVGRGLRARWSTWPPRCSTRPGTGSRPDTEVGDPIAFERAGAGGGRRRLRPGAAALPDDVLPAHLRRRLRGRLLLLHLVGGARRRHRGVVQGERRAAPGERRRLPQPAALASAARSTRWPPSAPSAAATPTPARCSAAAVWRA